MSRLCQRYSACGVSLGRSVRSRLLERVMSFLPLVTNTEGGVDIDTLDQKILEAEICHRLEMGDVPEVQLSLFFDLALMPEPNFLALLVREMVYWYKEDEKHEWPLVCEQGIVRLIWELMSGPGYVEQFNRAGHVFSLEELFSAADDRYYCLTRSEVWPMGQLVVDRF